MAVLQGVRKYPLGTQNRSRKATRQGVPKMTDKWIVTLVLGFILVSLSPLAIMEYGKSNCRIEAIKAGVEADKINVACGVK
jgi:hypothetical protein